MMKTTSKISFPTVILVLFMLVLGLSLITKSLTTRTSKPVEVETLPTPTSTRQVIHQSLASREKELTAYSAVDPSELINLPNNMVLYRYRKGNLYPDLERWGWHKNYDLVFPNTWTAYTYTSKNKDEYFGTNTILRKGDDVIYISQQQNEDGACQLTKEDIGMPSFRCNLIYTFAKPKESFRVYTIDYTNLDYINESPWILYGVCETFKNNGGEPCSPGLKTGKITFSDMSRSQNNFIEFVEIVKNIKVVE